MAALGFWSALDGEPLVPTLAANAAMVVLALWLMQVGLREDRGRPFAAGVAYFLFWAVLRYIDLFGAFGGMLGAALVFFLCGATLLRRGPLLAAAEGGAPCLTPCSTPSSRPRPPPAKPGRPGRPGLRLAPRPRAGRDRGGRRVSAPGPGGDGRRQRPADPRRVDRAPAGRPGRPPRPDARGLRDPRLRHQPAPARRPDVEPAGPDGLRRAGARGRRPALPRRSRQRRAARRRAGSSGGRSRAGAGSPSGSSRTSSRRARATTTSSAIRQRRLSAEVALAADGQAALRRLVFD